MRLQKCGFVWGTVAMILSFATLRAAEVPNVAKIAADLADGQQLLELRVRVVDSNGKPVAKAKVTPWALQSSQGHGWWREGDKRAGVGPQAVFTAEDGTAVVLYPRYNDVEEQIGTLSVSLFIDHPDFAFVDDMHIDVPHETDAPYEIKLARGVPVEIRPLLGGKPADLDNLFAVWSDGRSWQKGAAPEKTEGGTLRFPAVAVYLSQRR